MSESFQSAPTASPFNEDYFMRGKASGLSNYENYEWKRDLTVFCCTRMMQHLGAQRNDSVLDYGCARGFYVKALAMLGFHSSGYDISEWAIQNCDPEVAWRVSSVLKGEFYDWVMCKDVLEHIPDLQLDGVIEVIIRMAKKGALIIVPLMDDRPGSDPTKFRAPQDNEDKTHINCWSLSEWLNLIQAVIEKMRVDYTVSGSYRLPGVKEACDPYPNSVGFFTIRKL